jgi:hypothetical protein
MGAEATLVVGMMGAGAAVSRARARGPGWR